MSWNSRIISPVDYSCTGNTVHLSRLPNTLFTYYVRSIVAIIDEPSSSTGKSNSIVLSKVDVFSGFAGYLDLFSFCLLRFVLQRLLGFCGSVFSHFRYELLAASLSKIDRANTHHLPLLFCLLCATKDPTIIPSSPHFADWIAKAIH